jgi:hypothetical protein
VHRGNFLWYCGIHSKGGGRRKGGGEEKREGRGWRNVAEKGGVGIKESKIEQIEI